MKNVLNKALLAAAMCSLIGLATAPAMAETITSMNTGTAQWKLSNKPSTDTTTVAIGALAPTTPRNSNWIAPTVANGLSPAVWIGPSVNGNQRGTWGDYVYALDFDVAATGPVGFDGYYSSDNVVTSIYVDNVANTIATYSGNLGLIDTPSTPYVEQFRVSVEFFPSDPPILSVPPTTHTLYVVVHNDLAPSMDSGLNNPTGFIMAGTITTPSAADVTIPSPAAFAGGLVLLGGIALTKLRGEAQRGLMFMADNKNVQFTESHFCIFPVPALGTGAFGIRVRE